MSTLSKDEYGAEYMCIPFRTDGLVYKEFSNENIVLPNFDFSQSLLHIGVDFNIDRMTAIVGVKKENCFFIIDEIVLEYKNSNTYQLAKEIKRRYPGRKILLYPDASGRNRNTASVDPNNTNHTVLRENGFSLVFDYGGNPPILDSTLLVNQLIRNANDQCRLFISPRCNHLLDTLWNLKWDGEIHDKHSGLDHASDCLRYMIWHIYSQRNGFMQKSIY